MRTLFIFCAACCFLALLKLPITYYTLLRIIVSLGAILAVYLAIRKKNYVWTFIFTIIAIIFNPLFPVYLHRKLPWVPIDIMVGLLFLLLAFWKKKISLPEEKITAVFHAPKIRTRDRIVGLPNKIDDVENLQTSKRLRSRFLKLYLTLTFNRARKNQSQNY
ncbi:DUF6804 family protein [Pedobacter albus]|uniref:DUF6804 family protein n=1 Tax=Pedobacter albus TaxID=3113905 RepID=UPI003D6644AC